MDLSFTLINEGNVSLLIRELLAFLEVADNEFKPRMTSQIGVAADQYAPNKRWHVDTMLRVLKLAGNYVKEQILSSFVRLIATSPDQQTYCVQKLYASLKEDITQEGLTLAGAWVIGEFGDALLRGGGYEEEELVRKVEESEVIDLFITILNSAYATQIVTEYIVTSAMKLTTRLQDPSQIDRIRRILSTRTSDLSIEIQQRAVEYGNLFAYDSIRKGVLERMPPPEIHDEQRGFGEPSARQKKAATKIPKPNKQIQAEDLLDLVGGAGSMDLNYSANMNGSQNNASLLEDILGGGNLASSPAAQPSKSNAQDILGLFGTEPNGRSSQPSQQTSSGYGNLLGTQAQTSTLPPTSTASHPIYNNHDISLNMQVQRSGGVAQVLARFRNESAFDQFTGVGLQAAVPKSQKLQLNAISKADLEGGEEAIQQMRVTAVNGVGHLP